MSLIYYDLQKSDYKVDYLKYTFYFSSELYMNKFKEKLLYTVYTEFNKLNAKYNGFIINSKLLIAITLYKRIEKRGFRIVYNNKELKEPLVFSIELIKE